MEETQEQKDERMSWELFPDIPKKTQQQFETALVEAQDRIRDMDESIEKIIDKKYPKQTSVGGTINNVYFGMSIERIVIYLCITVVLVVWLSN